MLDGDGGGRELFATEVSAADVTARRPALVDTPAGRLALVRDGVRIVAIDAWCPHLDGPLWEGATADGQVACPWHGWRFSLRTGTCTWAPAGDAGEAAEAGIRVLATRVGDDGRVVVELG